jgi:hypothetical protein
MYLVFSYARSLTLTVSQLPFDGYEGQDRISLMDGVSQSTSKMQYRFIQQNNVLRFHTLVSIVPPSVGYSDMSRGSPGVFFLSLFWLRKF